MLLRLFKSNSIGIIFLLPVLAVILWSDIFMQNRENFVPLPYSMPAYSFIMKYLSNEILSGVIALILITLQAFYLMYINKVYNFISKRTYLTSLIFVLISSAFLNLHYLHPAIIANIFILLTIVEVFDSYKKPRVFSASFNSGFLIAIAGLFYINANFFIIFVFLGLLVLHTFNWREWFAVILGFITPYLITIFLYYLNGNLQDLEIILNAIINHNSPKLIWPISYYLFSLVLSLIGIFSVIKLSTSYSNNKISTRNYFFLFTLLIVLIISIFIIIPFASIELIVIIAIPVSYLLSNYYLSESNKIIQEVSFIVLLSSFLFFYLQKYFEFGTFSIF